MLALALNEKNLPYPEPIHPIIVHFVIALILFAFVCDVVGFFWKNPRLHEISFWNLLGASFTGVFAVLFGQFEANISKHTEDAEFVLNSHTVIGWVILALVIFITIWRFILRAKNPLKVTPIYLLVATVLASLVSIQSLLGSFLFWVYGLHVEPVVQAIEKTGLI